jgi:predicted acylesterase/phospholipase RssA
MSYRHYYKIEKYYVGLYEVHSIIMANTFPRIQRALLLQGGGALGAFQAGAFKALYEKLRSDDEKDGNANKPLFDIIAGTSIGAINAAIIVSYVLETKPGMARQKDLKTFGSICQCLLQNYLKH